MRKVSVVVMALAALWFAPVAHADEGKEGDGWGKKAVKALDLTADQQSKLKAVDEDRKKTQTPLWEQLGTQMKELKALVGSKAADAELTAKLDQLKATHEQIETNRKNFDEQKSQILTPMQRAKVTLWMGKKAKDMMEHMKHGEGDK